MRQLEIKSKSAEIKRGEITAVDAMLYDTGYQIDFKGVSLVARVGQNGKYLFNLPVEQRDGSNIAILIEEESPLHEIEAGQYDLEVEFRDMDNLLVFPSEGYATITLSNTLLTETGEAVTTISLQTFEGRFSELEADVKTKLENLEAGVDGKPGKDGTDGKPGANGKDGKSAYELAQDNGFVGSEQEWLTSLVGPAGTLSKSDVKVITGYRLDRTTTPWTIVFNTGTTLQFPEYATTATVYGYGFAANVYSTTMAQYPIPSQIMQVVIGAVTLAGMAKGTTETYWSDNYAITNPIQNASKFDWSKATLGHTDSYKARDKNMIKAYYELGLLTDDEVISVGAVASEVAE